jgi:hypothetical protein
MITAIYVENFKGEILTLNLSNQNNQSSFIVSEITGLDPVKAELATYPYAKFDGVKFQSSRRGSRNIVFTIEIPPYAGSTSVEDRRLELYRYFLPKQKVKLTFWKNGYEHSYTEGIVESFESNFFTDEPEVSISVLCFDPDFIEAYTNTVTGATIDLNYLGNPGYGEADYILDNYGDVPVGFNFTMNVDVAADWFTLSMTGPDTNEARLTVIHALVADDVVTIRDYPNDKSIKLYRAATEYNILGSMDWTSTWPQLLAGINHFRVESNAASGIPWSLDYEIKYGGL